MEFVSIHTTHRQLIDMLYGQILYFHTTYRQIFHMFYGKKFLVHTTYGKVVYMLYGQVVYIFHIDKDMSDDTEQVHNESIYMTYFRKIYTKIAPTGHNISLK